MQGSALFGYFAFSTKQTTMGKSKHFSRQPQPYDAKMDETASKDWKILLGTTTNAPPEPSLFDRGA